MNYSNIYIFKSPYSGLEDLNDYFYQVYMRLIFIFISLLIVASCKGPDLADPITVDLNGDMFADLDGSLWSSGSENSATINYLNNEIHVEGYLSSDGIIRNHISIIVKETTEGTFNSQIAKGTYYDVQSKSTFISSNSCNVDILNLDLDAKLISGTFSFNALPLDSGESIEVLNGEFNNVNLRIVE